MASEETELRELIREFLTKQQVFFWHNLQVGLKRRYKPYPGLPDLEGVWRGKHFYIEVKAPGKGLSPTQARFREDIYKHGQGKEAVIVAHDLEAFLKQWQKFTH